MIYKAYKFRLYPTEEQKIFLSKCFGCNRFIYNWALNLKKSQYEKDKKNISIFDIAKEINKLKQQPEFQWLKEVSSRSGGYSLRHLDAAFNNFFREIKKGNKKQGFPKFKSKYNRVLSFQTDEIKLHPENGCINIPKFKTPIECIFHRKYEGKPKASTISKTNTGNYFISVLVETEGENPTPPPITRKNTVGIDLGIRSFAVIGDGEKEIKRIEHPHFLKTNQKRIARLQKKLARKTKGSNGYKRQLLLFGKLHEKIKNRREDFLHNESFDLTKNPNFATIAVEKLGITNMMKNGHSNLAYDIGDSGWFSFKTKLKYKSEREGKNFIECGRFDPTSKTCPFCKTKNEQLKDEKDWVCPTCKNHVMDRDINGANQVKNFALKNLK